MSGAVDVVIRPARGEDADALSALHSSSFPDGWTPADFRAWLSHAHGFAVIATHGQDGPVGFGLGLAAGEDGEILSIAVRPDIRTQGLGRRIIASLDGIAVNRGLKRWVLEVARNNPSAIALYRGAGFVEISVRKAYYKGEEGAVDALVMAQDVGGCGGQDRA